MVLVLTCQKARCWWWLKPLQVPSEAPLLWQHSLTGLWGVILRGDSPASHFFPFPYQLSRSQVGAFSNVLCISWDPPPRGEQTMSACIETPLKWPNVLVLAGSQGWYAYLKKSLIPVRPRLGLWVPRPYLLNFWFSQVYIPGGVGQAKALRRVRQYGYLSNAQRQAIAGLTGFPGLCFAVRHSKKEIINCGYNPRKD